jgi:gas vesicle protein
MTSGRIILSLLLAGAAIGVAAGIIFEPKKDKAIRMFGAKKGKAYGDELDETFNGFIDSITEKLEAIKKEALQITKIQRVKQEETEMDAATRK